MPGGGSDKVYLHNGRDPVPPEGGWQAARISEKNPAFKYLKQEFKARRIDWRTPPAAVYNSHPKLYIIAPGKFPEFWKRSVKEVLKKNTEDIVEDEASSQASNTNLSSGTTSSTISSPTNNSSILSTATMSLPSEVSTSTEFSDPHTRYAPPVTVGKDGMVVRAYDGFVRDPTKPLPHQQMELPKRTIITRTGNIVLLIPLEGMTAEDIIARAAKGDPTVANDCPVPLSAGCVCESRCSEQSIDR